MLFIGSDHGGFALKGKLKSFLSKQRISFVDVGTDSGDSVDYPQFAKRVANFVASTPKSTGVLVCGTGVGVSIAANRVKGVRAAILYSDDVAKLSREHNDANIAVFGGRTMSASAATRRLKLFLDTPFSKESRHKRRVKQLDMA